MAKVKMDFRIEASQKQRLNEIAESDGVKPGDILRILVRDFLRSKEQLILIEKRN